MGKTRASSSKRPHVEEEQHQGEEENSQKLTRPISSSLHMKRVKDSQY